MVNCVAKGFVFTRGFSLINCVVLFAQQFRNLGLIFVICLSFVVSNLGTLIIGCSIDMSFVISGSVVPGSIAHIDIKSMPMSPRARHGRMPSR